jgi:hypothetical protein
MAGPSSLRIFLLGEVGDDGDDTSITAVAEHRDASAVSRIQLSAKALDELRGEIGALRGFVEGGFPEFTEVALQTLGTRLFNLLLHGDVKRLWDRGRPAPDEIRPLEILAEDREIAAFPWEYLYDEGTQGFIGQECHPICRNLITLPAAQGTAGPTATARRKVLVVLGAPPSDPRVSAAEELRWIQDRLSPKGFIIQPFRAQSPPDLERALDESGCDVLHFIGHGGFDADKDEGYLELIADDRKETRFYARPFAQAAARRGIKLIFLNACETGVAAKDAPPSRSSLAAALLQRGIPGVIASQFSLPDASAHLFSSRVYERIAQGQTLAGAVLDGRRMMLYSASQQHVDWGIPVLYTSDPDQVLFLAPPEARPESVTRSSEPRERSMPVRTRTAPASRPDLLSEIERAFADKTIKPPADLPNKALGAAPKESTASPSEPTRSAAPRSSAAPHVRVALFDIDAKIGFLPDLTESANRAQTYYSFEVVHLPVPAGSLQQHTEEPSAESQALTFVPRLERTLSNAKRRLNVDRLCGLTRYLLAGQNPAIGAYSGFFAASLVSDPHAFILSTCELRSCAEQARLPFEHAALRVCLAMLLATDERWGLSPHLETVGCPFDFCEFRSDLVQGLRHDRFDHRPCRDRIKDGDQLAAIDALFALGATARSPEP